MRLAIAAAALIATALPAAANAQGAPYRAHGTEPFWSLTIDARTIRMETADGRPVSVATPKVIIGFAGEIYQTRLIGVNIVHRACTDGMSDRSYPDTVQVTVGGRSYQGCGGTELAPAPRSPLDGDWRVLSIGGRPVVPGTTVTASFRDGKLGGNTGCNLYNGPFDFRRGVLTAGPIISTKRACMRTTGPQEQALLGLLGQRLSVSQGTRGRLILTAPRRGGTIVLVREGR